MVFVLVLGLWVLLLILGSVIHREGGTIHQEYWSIAPQELTSRFLVKSFTYLAKQTDDETQA